MMSRASACPERIKLVTAINARHDTVNRLAIDMAIESTDMFTCAAISIITAITNMTLCVAMW